MDYKRIFAHAIIRRIAYVLVGLLFSIILSFDALAYNPDRSQETFDREVCFALSSGGGCAYNSVPRRSNSYDDIATGYRLTQNNLITPNYKELTNVRAPTGGSSTYSKWDEVTKNSSGTTISSANNVHAWFGSRYSCPAGSTLNGTNNTCTWNVSCTLPQIRNTEGACVDPPPPPCPNGGSAGSGWVPDTPLTTPNSILLCVNGCNAYIQSIDDYGTSIVNGQTVEYRLVTATHFPDTHSKYGTCATPDTLAISPPSDTCAVDQFIGTINGKTVCVDADSGTVANTNPNQVTETTTTSAPVTNNDNSVTTTTTTTNINGGTTTITTTVHPDGSQTVSTSHQNGPLGPTPETVDICKTSPNIAACEKVQGSIIDGSFPGTSDAFYESSYPNGIDGVWSDFQTAIDQTSFNSAIQSLAPNWSGGSCPTWSIDFSGIGLGAQDLTVPCYIWDLIGIIFIVSALFASRQIIFGG